MSVSREEQTKRGVAFLVASGLRGAGDNKLAKRLELAAGDSKAEVLALLTIIEWTPGLSSDCFKLVVMGKAILNGHLEWHEPLYELAAYMNGMGPMPADEPN